MPESSSEVEYFSRTRDHLGSIKKDLGDLQGWRSLAAELIQNADDAGDATEMSFTVDQGALQVWNDGSFTRCPELGAHECPWQARGQPACDFHSFRNVAGGSKEDRSDATGAFGIGFTAVYQITDRPVLTSSGKRWTIDETATDGRRIQSVDIEATAGTTLELPWAREDSHMRRSLEQPVVTDATIHDLTRELVSTIPSAMLFLRRLQRITIVAPTTSTTFSREISDTEVVITSSEGPVRKWFLMTGSFDDAAAQLCADHPNELRAERDTDFEIAVELSDDPSPGRFFATLPTDHLTGLPISVQGSFYPKPDRKRIRLDNAGPDKWNRAIIDAAASLVADSLEPLCDACDDQMFVSIVNAALELSHRVQAAEVDESFGCWWTRISGSLPTARVVPTTAGRRRLPSTCRLWSSHSAELLAAEALEELGLHLVATPVRADWFGPKDAIGLHPLNLGHMVKKLEDRAGSIAECFADGESDSAQSLWKLIDYLIETPGKSNADSRKALKRCRIFPTVAGQLRTAEECKQAPRGTVELLADAEIPAALLDGRLVVGLGGLLSVVDHLTPTDMAELIETADHADLIPATFDRGRLLDWFTNRRADVKKDLYPAVAALSIFPSGDGFQPLGSLTLPVEGFRDPLNLAGVLNLKGRPHQTHDFVNRLGAPELTFEHYCTDLVVRAAEDGLGERRLDALLDLLATDLSRIQDNRQVQAALRPLDLVRCSDGHARPGIDVYFAGIDPHLVGSERPIAASPSSGSLRRLYEWLGVRSAPRPADIVEQCRSLPSSGSDLETAAAHVIRYLSRLTPQDWDLHFESLRTMNWLPEQGERERPTHAANLFTVFRQNLFRSQGRFLDIGQKDQQKSRDFLKWLGVRTEPDPSQVVAHLLHLRDHSSPAKGDLYDFLNQHAEHESVRGLSGTRCILVGDGSYVLPRDCFWSEQPFGHHRHHLDDKFRQWRRLLDQLGVRDRPEVRDAVEVMQDIAVAHGGADGPLLDADREVVNSCWTFIESEVRAGRAHPNELDELARTECVLATDGSLRRPAEVLYRDASAIRDSFDESAQRFLIERPENMAHAMDLAGVRHLREALSTSVVERIDSNESDRLSELLRERRLATIRVLAAVEQGAGSMLDSFLHTVQVVPLLELAVVESIEVGGRRFESSKLNRAALFDSETNEFLVVEDDAGGTRWTEVAVELAVALGVTPIHVPGTAMSLKSVLDGESNEEVERTLDEMQFPPLDESVDVDLIDDVTATFFDDDTVGDQQDVRADEEETTAIHEDDSDASASAKSTDSEPVTTEVPAAPGDQDLAAPGDDQQAERSGSKRRTHRPEDDAATLSRSESGSPTQGGSAGKPAGPGHSTDPSTRVGSAGRPRRPKRTMHHEREVLRSYVRPAGEADADRERDSEGARRREEIDAAAVDAVVSYEKKMGREPERMPHENEGFDLISTSADGTKRFIEIKGTSPRWDKQGVALSDRQFQEARDRTSEFWLYVVEVGLQDSEPIRIQDPATRVKQYFFDSGWRVADEVDATSERRLPELPLLEDGGDPSSVPLCDWRDPTMEIGWIDVGDAGDHLADTSAIQIAGEALGISMRGGVVLFSPATPQDHDWVVVSLREQVDPDTGSTTCVRLWVPETDINNTLLGVRLQSDSAVPPITIENPGDVEVLGVVTRQLRIDALRDIAGTSDS